MRAETGNYERAASEFLVALRGARSQRVLARRLGYQANPITDWENGRRYPTAEEALRVAKVVGVNVTAAFEQFQPLRPLEVRRGAFMLAKWLDAVRGSLSFVELARRAQLSRFSVGRWCRGQAKPRLPDFFRLVDAATDRLPDLVALMVPISEVPALAVRYHLNEMARRAAYDAPWTEAILRVVESTEYADKPCHEDGFIGSLLGLSQQDEETALELLERAGAIRRVRDRFEITGAGSVDTGGDVDRVSALLQHWLMVARDRVPARRSGREYYAYNVCALSHDDYQRVRALLARAFNEIRAIVAASEPNERIALVNLGVVDLFVD